MELSSTLAIGVVIGILVGAVLLWLLDRRHQKVVKKLIESRRKIERQRTQAVNDLFALRAEIENGTYRVDDVPAQQPAVAAAPDPRMLEELTNLRSLIARADGALTAARRKRDLHEQEIAKLRAMLEEKNGENVINLRQVERPADKVGNGNLAL